MVAVEGIQFNWFDVEPGDRREAIYQDDQYRLRFPDIPNLLAGPTKPVRGRILSHRAKIPLSMMTTFFVMRKPCKY
jgi:hypothetical protein